MLLGVLVMFPALFLDPLRPLSTRFRQADFDALAGSTRGMVEPSPRLPRGGHSNQVAGSVGENFQIVDFFDYRIGYAVRH